MYNLKQNTGTYKGMIGECLFKSTRRYAIITKFFNKNKYFSLFGDKLSLKEKDFLEKNWFSIDAIEINYSSASKEITLFEIKTRNKLYNPKPFWKTKMTASTYNIYREAIILGFKVNVATVWLFDNWDYDVEIIDFNESEYSIDNPKEYDKGFNYFNR